MPIVLGLLAALGIGVSDYFGRYCTRRASAVTTVITALLAGGLAAVLLTMVVPGSATGRDLALGAASGVLVGFALASTYAGMAVSSTAVVSPIVAFFVAAVPVGWDLAGGARLSTLRSLGVGLAIAGIVVATISPELRGRIGAGLAFALGGGVLFGIGMTVVGETSIESGVWPAVGQRFAAWATLFLYGTARAAPRLLPGGLRRWGIVSGLAGTVGVAMFILGAQRGDLGPVAVTSSLFPAVTAVLAVVFDDDRLRWWQWIGLAMAVTGVGLIAAG